MSKNRLNGDFLEPKIRKIGRFAAKNDRHFRNRPNFGKKLPHFFCHHVVCIWSKFQLHRTFLLEGVSTNVKCQFSRFKVPGPFFWQKLAYFPSIFLKIRKISHILWFCMIQTMKIHEKPSKTRSKTIFGSKKSRF